MPIPEDIIARVPQWKEAKDLRFSPLGGGITNRNFRVDVGGESFVLRVAGANTELLGIDRENEYLANRLAGERGIAPEVYYYIHPEGYLVTKFVPGRPLPPEELKQPENLQIGISDLDFDFREYADKHFKCMTQNLKDPRWGEWLSIIRHNS